MKLNRRAARRGQMWNSLNGLHEKMTAGVPVLGRPATAKIARSGKARGVRGLAAAILGVPLTTDAQPRDHATWSRLKEDLVSETAGSCEACHHEMPEPSALHLHHVVPRSKGGRDEENNAALLCPNCHAKAHLIYRKSRQIPAGRDELFQLLAA